MFGDTAVVQQLLMILGISLGSNLTGRCWSGQQAALLHPVRNQAAVGVVLVRIEAAG